MWSRIAAIDRFINAIARRDTALRVVLSVPTTAYHCRLGRSPLHQWRMRLARQTVAPRGTTVCSPEDTTRRNTSDERLIAVRVEGEVRDTPR